MKINIKDIDNISLEDITDVLLKRGISLSTAEQIRKDIAKTKTELQRQKEIKLRDTRDELKKALKNYAAVLLDEDPAIIAAVLDEGFAEIEKVEKEVLKDKSILTTTAAKKIPSSSEIIEKFIASL